MKKTEKDLNAVAETEFEQEVSWREGHHYFSAHDPAAVADCLRQVRSIYGNMKAQSVVEWAERHPNSALWRCFEWDNVIAGNKHRLRQAGVLVASIQVTVFKTEPKMVNVKIKKIVKGLEPQAAPHKKPERTVHYDGPLVIGVQGKGPFTPNEIAQNFSLAYQAINHCRKMIRAAYDRIRLIEQLQDSLFELSPHFDEIDRILLEQVVEEYREPVKKVRKQRRTSSVSSPPA